jgi:hypothetical protein
MSQFLSSRTHYELNVSAALKNKILAEISRGDVSPDLLDPIQTAAEKEMAGDFMFRFIKSTAWQTLLSSEPVRRQPPVSPVVKPVAQQIAVIEPVALPPVAPAVAVSDRQPSMSSSTASPAQVGTAM